MRSYLLCLVVCFAAINSAFALEIEKSQLLACLHDNGFNNFTDIDPVRAFMLSGPENQKEFHLEKQYTCFVACEINAAKNEVKNYKKSIYQLIKDIVGNDDRISAELKRDMKYHLEKCHQQDEGDDCKLLYCIKVLRYPFKNALITIFDMF